MMLKQMKKYLLFSCFLSLFIFIMHTATAQDNVPKVLVVTAHPDDETAFSVTMYKVAHELHGIVDQCVITNGEGGYKYSTLAEDYYHVELTDEKVGRQKLPQIRKQELMNADRILGVRNIYFLDQKDAHYGLNEREPLDTSWDVPWVLQRLKKLMTTNHYDYVFCLVPDSGTHGGHKAASMLALQTVQLLPEKERPVILAGTVVSKNDTIKKHFTQLKDYTYTRMNNEVAPFVVDRTATFGYKHTLNYKIIANWEIAEHKSQGTMHLYYNMGDYEHFLYFAINSKDKIESTRKFFEKLKNVPYPSKTY
jgi:LmbE family N-acetylglucosaminyl deacetylase